MKQTRFSFFWKCFVTYVVCTLIFLCVQLFSYNNSESLLKKSYIYQVESTFMHNAEKLSNELSNLYHFPKIMNFLPDFVDLKKEESIYSPQHSRKISFTMNTMATHSTFYSLVDDVVVYMYNSDLCVTPDSFYMTLDSWNESYQYSHNNIKDIIINKVARYKSLEILPRDTVRVRGLTSKDYVGIIMKESADTCTYLFMINEEDVFEFFQLSSLPDNIYFKITDANGNNILEYGASQQSAVAGDVGNYYTFAADIPTVGSNVTISIPNSYFQAITREAHLQMGFTMLLSLIVGCVLAFVFSRIAAQPVQHIIQSQNIPVEHQTRNEFATLYNYISDTQSQQYALQSKLVASLVVKIFSGVTVTPSDLDGISQNKLFSSFPLRVAIVRYHNYRQEQEFQSMMLHQLKESMPSDFVIEPINIHEIGLIFSAENSVLVNFKSYLDSINVHLQQENRIICGVSAPFLAIEDISLAARQARFSLPRENESFVVFSDFEALTYSYTVPDCGEIQNALFNWNKSKLDELFDEMENAVINASVVVTQQLYYTILSSIRDAASVIKLPADFFNGVAFNKNIANDANIRVLKALVDRLFEGNTAFRANERKQRNKEIVNYINVHFDDPILTTSVVAQMYNLSERTINTILNEETGMSFANYLTEMRMQKAGEMLRNTSIEVLSVSEKCGMTPSTFYRNFKKYYGMTPAEYKTQFTE